VLFCLPRNPWCSLTVHPPGRALQWVLPLVELLLNVWSVVLLMVLCV
jgi:hypothetical protein